FGDARSFLFSCPIDRHGDGLEALERKKRFDRYPKVARDFHRELQARLVVATLEVTNRLIVHPDRLGQLPPRHASLGAKNSYSVMEVQSKATILDWHCH